MQGRPLICVALAALALMAAGCGGAGEEGVPADEWTERLCSSVTAWTGALGDSTTRLRSPERITLNGFKGAVNNAVKATRTFVEDVGALGPPATDAGDDVERELARLRETLAADADALSDEVEDARGGLPGLLARLSAVTGTLSGMADAVGSAFDRLSNLEGADELEAAFGRARSCRQLGPTR